MSMPNELGGIMLGVAITATIIIPTWQAAAVRHLNAAVVAAIATAGVLAALGVLARLTLGAAINRWVDVSTHRAVTIGTTMPEGLIRQGRAVTAVATAIRNQDPIRPGYLTAAMNGVSRPWTLLAISRSAQAEPWREHTAMVVLGHLIAPDTDARHAAVAHAFEAASCPAPTTRRNESPT